MLWERLLCILATSFFVWSCEPEDNDEPEEIDFYDANDDSENGEKKNGVLLSPPMPRPKNCRYCKLEGDIWVYDSKASRSTRERVFKYFAKRSNLKKRRMNARKMIWLTPFVPYVFHSSVGSKVMSAVKQAIEDFGTWTCIRFVRRTIEPDYVNFTTQYNGCWSELGRVKGEQEISLGDNCNTKGSALHELMHTLGFLHEHTRLIRDSAIKIVVENIKSRKMDNFDKYPHYLTDKYNLPFDYDSITNFRPLAFSANKRPTILSKDSSVNISRIGQRTRLSDQDVKLINLVYKCKQENAADLGNDAISSATPTENTPADEIAGTLPGVTNNLDESTKNERQKQREQGASTKTQAEDNESSSLTTESSALDTNESSGAGVKNQDSYEELDERKAISNMADTRQTNGGKGKKIIANQLKEHIDETYRKPHKFMIGN